LLSGILKIRVASACRTVAALDYVSRLREGRLCSGSVAGLETGSRCYPGTRAAILIVLVQMGWTPSATAEPASDRIGGTAVIQRCEPVSRGNSPFQVEKPRFSAVVRAGTSGLGRQRHAGAGISGRKAVISLSGPIPVPHRRG
jgi:hypothetical protein